MRLQSIQDSKGKETGVFIPIEDWLKIKIAYPDIEEADNEVPQWEKKIIDERLEAIEKNPNRIKTDNGLLNALKA
jgi:hypothetical protein